MTHAVTIGIPVFESVDYIGRAMESALAQTYPDIEFLIVDDCGSDSSMNVVEQLCQSHPRGKEIRILRNDCNRGVGFSRNRLMAEAHGAYLYFMDSDDTINPDTIELLVGAIRRNKSQVAYGSYEIIDTIDNVPTQVYQKGALSLDGEDELALYAFRHNHIFHVSVCNCLMDMSFLRQTGVRFIDAHYWEDMAFTCDFVTKVWRAVLLPNITYHYWRRPNSLSHYNTRESFSKSEILSNVATINYIKSKCSGLRGRSSLPYLCYNLEMISFYMVCHILKHRQHMSSPMTASELREVIRHPLSASDIVHFRRKLFPNMAMWLLGQMPTSIFIPLIWLMGKLKRAI